ncbi:MAG: hypothetical protein ACXQS8_03200, partial [Candidatus Helarchaeales archaeon]
MSAEILKLAARLVKDGENHVKNTKNFVEAAFNYSRALSLFTEYHEHLDRRKSPSLHDFCERNISLLKKKILELAKQVTARAIELENEGELKKAADKHQEAIQIYQSFRDVITNSVLIKLCDENIQKSTDRIKQIQNTFQQ